MGFRLALFESQNIFSLKVLFLIELSEVRTPNQRLALRSQSLGPNVMIPMPKSLKMADFSYQRSIALNL